MRSRPGLPPALPTSWLLLALVLAAAAPSAGQEPPGVEPPPAPLESFPEAPPESPAVTGVTESSPPGTLPSPAWGPVSLLGMDVAPGDKRRVFLRSSESFAGTGVDTPVLITRGLEAGPVLCATAGVHGDELNGIEVVRSVYEHTSPRGLSGMLVAIPIVNIHGFRRSSRYLPDRRDLNRFFPGHPAGSSASRIAWSVWDGVMSVCDVLVDFHTGSFHRTNMPQVRADLRRPGLVDLAKTFGVGIVIHSVGRPGTLRRTASERGIQAITFEAGEPMRFQNDEIDRGARGLRNLMAELGMLRGARRGPRSPLVFQRSTWVRVDDGGIFITDRELGDRVRAGDRLGTVTDPVSNERSEIRATVTGRVIGMAVSQVVIPGFAAFHIGVDAPTPDEGPPPAPGQPDSIPPDQLDPEEMPE